MQLRSAIVTVQTCYNYFINLFIYLRKCVLQHLCPSKFSKVLSAPSDDTAVVSIPMKFVALALSISRSVHKHCINSYNSNCCV